MWSFVVVRTLCTETSLRAMNSVHNNIQEKVTKLAEHRKQVTEVIVCKKQITVYNCTICNMYSMRAVDWYRGNPGVGVVFHGE